jgi:hypothetical protein
MINWLLLFVPFAVGLEHVAPERHLLIRDCVRSSFWGDTIQHQANCGDVQQCF